VARAIFLDRDGVITKNVYYEKWGETEGPMSPEDVVILPGAFDAMKRLENSGFLLFVVSNQGAFAKGKTELGALIKTARLVESLIRGAGVLVTQSYYSFSHPNGVAEYFSGDSLERKPNPYFLKIAEAAYDLDLTASWMIGDRSTDILCGRLAGCKTAKLTDGPDEVTDSDTASDISAHTLQEAAALILGWFA
jgi:D-glycero-D-manno-heptose 1,7-bisphosphate phosphatase